MKSLIVEPAHDFKMVEREKPVADGKRVVIRTRDAAICGSDDMLWKARPGLALGHEFSGYIEDPGVFPFKKGGPCLCRGVQSMRSVRILFGGKRAFVPADDGG